MTFCRKYGILCPAEPVPVRLIRKEKKSMKKRIAAVFLMIGLLLGLCACAKKPPQGPDAYSAEQASQVREENHRYLTVWSWQIPRAEDAAAYAEQAAACGFTAVDLGVQWSAFEPLKGHFEWTWLDQTVKAFTEKGLAVSLQPLLWSKDLEWAEDLSFQESPSGVYEEEGRGSFLSLTDANNLSVVKNTLQNFALHVSTNYGASLTRWGVRLSCFGEFDYSLSEDLDYSPSSAVAFRSFLKERYDQWEDLSRAGGLKVSSGEDLDRISLQELAEAFPVEWRLCRQKVLLEFLDMTCGVLRSVDPTIPIVMHLGTYGNGMNAAYTGIVDLWTLLAKSDFDILSLTLSKDVPAGLILSFASSLSAKKLSVEVDGAGVWEDGDRDVVKEQVKTCGRYGVFSLSTSNYTLDQLKENKDFLSGFKGDLSPSETVAPADPSQGILVFTNGILRQEVPEGYDVYYDEIWETLSQSDTRRVRFVTDVQLASGETTLEGVADLYAGKVTGNVTVDAAFGDAFLKAKATLHGKVNPTFPDGTALKDRLGEADQGRFSEE